MRWSSPFCPFSLLLIHVHTLQFYSLRAWRASLVAQTVKNLSVMQETQVRSLSWEDPLEEGMVTHSSILAWRIPWTEEPGRLQSTGSQKFRHDWETDTFTLLDFTTVWVLESESQDLCRVRKKQVQVRPLQRSFFLFFAVPRGIWDLSSLTRDWTHAPYVGRVES